MTLNVVLTGSRAFGAAAADMIARRHNLTITVSPAFAPPYADLGAAYEQPDMRHDRLRAWATRTGTPWISAHHLNPQAIPDGTDVIVAAHSHAFIGRRTRARARLASIGYHPSLLPVHRGRDAIRWTLHDHDKITGGTIYHLTDNVDLSLIHI